MSETEKKVIETVDKLIPELPDEKKGELPSFRGGYGLMADKQPGQEAAKNPP